MRLLNTRTYHFEEFTADRIPQYAILSHTWGEEEVTFREMADSTSNITGKEGYVKIQKTCLKAADENYEYVWIDTCCIDKSSSAELMEAINSMYN